MFFKIKERGGILLESFNLLQRNDPLRLAGATAFFTTFALPPTLIILLQLFGLIVDRRQLGREIFHSLSETVGIASAEQIQIVYKGIKALAVNWYATIGGFAFLLFVSTTLFKVIKDSVNQLWGIRMVDKNTIGIQIQSRFKSFLVILLAGVLFFAGLVADGFQNLLGHYLQDVSNGNAGIFITLLNKLISLIIVTVWFTLLFRYLPDGKPSWKIAITGGLLTGVLFTLGRILLRILLPYKNINSVFGASGSFVLLLLFIFYSSFTIYYGACFIWVYAEHLKQKIKPRLHSSAYKVTDIEVVD